MSNPPKQKAARSSQSNGKPLRGLPKDSPEVRTSKTLSWVLRHGAKSEGLYMRPDGYVRVTDLVGFGQQLVPGALRLVEADSKSRYMLLQGPDETAPDAGEIWWIRANQGHSMKAVKLDLKPLLSASDIPMAVHGTNIKAWESIAKQGLSKMKRNHIHIAQGVPGDGVISGMRVSAQVLIYIDVQKALDAGILFFLSENGVVLTEGDERGFLSPDFFIRVENRNGGPVPGWPISSSQSDAAAKDS
ncbi:KptA family-domain-containing protein [Gloeopeniophorella convolvens]|nr:KptA family-domain-containing protein [Gloeopeniophorella convolvens]